MIFAEKICVSDKKFVSLQPTFDRNQLVITFKRINHVRN